MKRRKSICCAVLTAALLAAAALSGCGKADGGDRGAGNSAGGRKSVSSSENGAVDVDGSGSGTHGDVGSGSDLGTSEGEILALSKNEERQLQTVSLRIADGAETGRLVLAGEGAGDVYTFNIGGIPVYLDGALADASVLEDGMTADIAFDGSVMETYPMQLGNVSSISVYSRGSEKNLGGTYYDLCGLYLRVLNDLWEVDSGLNGGISYVSVDLSNAPGDLTEGEKAAIAWIFACEHQVEALTCSYEELAQQGFLTQVSTAADGRKLYQWDDGVLFSITAGKWEEDERYSIPVIRFNAQKWRSPLGAYFFMNCKAAWAEFGTWNGYSVEAEAIS